MPIELATFLQPAVQPIFDELFAQGKNFIVSNLFGSEEVANDTVEQWKKQLKMIQTVLLDLDNNESSSETVKAWRRNLQDVAYDMEDLLERYEIEAYEREHQQEHHQDVDDHPTSDTTIFGLPNNMVIAVTSISDRFSSLFNPKNSGDVQSKIDEIKKSLENMQTLNQALLNVDMKQQKTPVTRATASFPPRMVFGRDDKKQKIIEELFKDDQNDENYIVIPIVGKGGIGKTTLAQYVYHDKQLEGHFNFKAWVCVSEIFDVKRITTTILKDVSGSSDLNDAQEKLVKELKDKRFLIVLDDIWHDKLEDLELLLRPLQYAAKGSRVIITTRIVKIARMMSSTIINLEVLSDDDCWCLFQQVYGGSDLGEMRDDIIKMCKGLPLAAKALGGLLRQTHDEKDRKKIILQSETWRKENDVLPVLRLSYHHLPSHLKRVFAYCSWFPKDHVFEEMEVVLLWMAQGFLPENQRTRMEDIGHDYFCELVSRSLFEASHSSKKGFIMHDLIHDLALSAADGLCEVIDDTTDILHGFQRTRHVFLTGNAATLVKQQLHVASKWRTFLTCECIEDLEFVRGFKYVRTLFLSSNKMEVLPEYVGDLKHLRLLYLEFKKIKELPKSIGNLWNLQTLVLEDCYTLQKIPNIRFLGKLWHLKIGEDSNLKEMPMGIGELTNLESLDHFVLGDGDGDGERIRDLKNLNRLQGELKISGLQSVLKVEDAKEAQLDKKYGLDELCLCWEFRRDIDVDDNTERDVLEQLKPHSSIKKLKLDGYRGLRFPNWLRTPCFSKLVGMVLEDCEKCENLPALGQLPSLKNLTIQGMDGIKAIGAEFYGCHNPSFPVLETLLICEMTSWEKWVHPSAHDRAFPYLKELSIESCSALKELSPHLPSLEKLEIKECEGELSVSLERFRLLEVLEVYRCGSIQFTSGCSSVVQAASFELAHLTKFKISRCSGRISLPGGLLLPAVEFVSFEDCKDLGSLPRQLRNYTSLRSLKLEDVPKLEDICVPSSLCHLFIKKLNELQTISSSSTTISNLTSLVVEQCPSLERLPSELHQYTSLKKLRISRCPKIEEIPRGGLPTNLEEITIEDVSNLQEVGVHHLHSLRSLILENVGMTTEDLSIPSSLSTIFIFGILDGENNLKSISSSTTEDSKLTILRVSDCPKFKSLAGKFTFLSQLCIFECPEFQFPTEGGLPGNLTHLSVYGRMNEDKPIQEWGLHLLSSLQSLHLGYLGNSTITEAVECIPSPNLLLPSSLSQLDVSGFQNLKTIDCSSFTDINTLSIFDCPKFQSFGDLSRKLPRVLIQNCESLKPHLKVDPHGPILELEGDWGKYSLM